MNYDQTYCASPNCTNKCGRKLSDKDKNELSRNGFDRISYAYFCNEKLPLLSGITVTGDATVKMGPGCSVTALEGLEDK